MLASRPISISPRHPRPMALLPADIFQLPLPALVYLLPPSHWSQWILRGFLLLYTLLVAIPLILILVPISVVFLSLPWTWAHRFAVLPIHPDNLPPARSFLTAIERAIGIYIVSTAAWSVTGLGNAPDSSEKRTPKVFRATLRTVEWASPSEKKLDIDEVMLAPVPDEINLGVLGMDGVQRIPRRGFWVRQRAPSGPRSSSPPTNAGEMPSRQDRGDTPIKSGDHAVLFLAGGGYVTGFTLSHPFIYSLLRRLPPAHKQGGYSLLAPSVRKALDKDRSFPAPLLDALAGYCHLRQRGYAAENIIILGDSAGGGLSWSLMATLAILHVLGGHLGIPGQVALISPWLSLPPFQRGKYADLLDEPMLLNAARCYLARFPLLKHRPDPFASDLPLWSSAASRGLRSIASRFMRLLRGVRLLPTKLRSSDEEKCSTKSVSEEVLQPSDTRDVIRKITHLQDWLEPDIFTALTSHHPLISPCSDIESPLVSAIFRLLEENRTRCLVHAGTAEWFFEPAMIFAKAAEKSGVDIDVGVEKGGFHSESCMSPGEWGGASGRLVENLLEWLAREPSSSMSRA